MENFRLRPPRPSCRSKMLKLLYDVPYADPNLSGYLKRYYRPQDGPDFSRLDGEHCRLIKFGPVEMARAASFDKDSLKDIAAAAFIQFGYADRFTTVYLAPCGPREVGCRQ